MTIVTYNIQYDNTNFLLFLKGLEWLVKDSAKLHGWMDKTKSDGPPEFSDDEISSTDGCITDTTVLISKLKILDNK